MCIVHLEWNIFFSWNGNAFFFYLFFFVGYGYYLNASSDENVFWRINKRVLCNGMHVSSIQKKSSVQTVLGFRCDRAFFFRFFGESDLFFLTMDTMTNLLVYEYGFSECVFREFFSFELQCIDWSQIDQIQNSIERKRPYITWNVSTTILNSCTMTRIEWTILPMKHDVCSFSC